MISNTPTNWLEEWSNPVNFTGKTKKEIKSIKLRYKWYVLAYILAMNNFKRGPKHRIKSFTWKQTLKNPNKYFLRVNLIPRLKRKGGGQDGQIIPKSPKFPPPPSS